MGRRKKSESKAEDLIDSVFESDESFESDNFVEDFEEKLEVESILKNEFQHKKFDKFGDK